ncbi:MAG: DUF1549 and DUF1553 domain-containing protein [Planctomycetota bacterium]
MLFKTVRIVTRLAPPAACLSAAGVLLTMVLSTQANDASPDASSPEALDAVSAVSPADFDLTTTRIDELEVYPPAVSLTTREDRQGIVVRIRRPDGVTRDLTDAATYRVENPSIATIENNTLRPGSDGQTHLIVEHGGKTATIPVTVGKAAESREISFRLDVMPVLALAGCNNGSCHGVARGQDGFHLTLFGYDPATDYHAITRELPGRRINLADTERSLLLTKSIGAVPHTGGKLFEQDSANYQTLKRWLDAGAPDDREGVARLTGVQIMPLDIVLQGKDATQPITVLARYSDGTTRDVTDLAVLMTSNEVSAAIGADGVITAGDRGEAFVMARYGEFTVGTPVIVIPREKPDEPAYPEDLPANNYIDELVNAKLQKMRIVPSEVCDDRTYARRVYLDIVGQLPPVDELEAFVASGVPDKRERLVDSLLERNAFVDIWAMKWAERLMIRSGNQNQGDLSPKAAVLYYDWLRDQIANNRPMNQIVHDLVSANGGTFSNPATNFYELDRDTLKTAENTVQVFIGARMQCAQCHNHPFDRWTMDDYYGFAAFFAQLARKPGGDPRERVVFNRGNGEVKHPVTNQNMAPTFLGGEVAEVPRGTDRRTVLADWLTSPENTAFNHNLANIVWDHYLGRGITHPVDDVRVSNPPVNPQLLDALAARLVETDYDMKQLVRDITGSLTYQRSTVPNASNAGDTTNFSRAHVRRIRAEVLLDCITQATHTTDDFRGLPRGARAVQIIDGNTSTYFLTTFGRASRDTVCSCEVVMEPNLSQALHLINGNTTNQKIRRGGLVKGMLNQGQTPEQIVTHLYLTTLSRPPIDEERQRIMSLVGTAENKREVLEDVFWALLNSKEFMFNH